jgi:D-alanyl-D-alanine carboxypeptidase
LAVSAFHTKLSVFALMMLALLANDANAQSPTLVVDASNGNVISAEDATRPWNPASTTKMMTAYVALRAVQTGVLTLDTPLIASANAARQKPSKLGIRPGQEITLDNALKVLMVKSANDLAVVIAEAIGGSVPGFSNMMNAEARRLGMNETRFMNPHGFHADGHQSSARDLAILAIAMLKDFPQYSEYWGIGAVQAGNRVMHNTNGLIGRYSGANGFKTGFVCASGFNLVGMATRGGRTLITVVLGASSGGERVVRSAQLLDQGFASWGGNGQTLRSLPSSGYASAPNMRSRICSGRRGVILADDSDYGGAILADSHSGDSMAAGSPMAFFALQQPSANTRGVSIRSSGGRAILGPRASMTPIAIYYGRAPGSTAVALGPGGRRSQPVAAQDTLPASASAIAPAGRPVPGLAPGQNLGTNTLGAGQIGAPRAAAAPRPNTPASQASIRPKEEPKSDRTVGAPLQLPGVSTTAPKANPKAQKAQAAAPKATTADKKNSAQAAPKKATPKSSKRKPVEDDE